MICLCKHFCQLPFKRCTRFSFSGQDLKPDKLKTFVCALKMSTKFDEIGICDKSGRFWENVRCTLWTNSFDISVFISYLNLKVYIIY